MNMSQQNKYHTACEINFLKIPSPQSTRYGTDSLLFRACLVWKKLPLAVKQSQSL